MKLIPLSEVVPFTVFLRLTNDDTPEERDMIGDRNHTEAYKRLEGGVNEEGFVHCAVLKSDGSHGETDFFIPADELVVY